jgi:hypothetical protein
VAAVDDDDEVEEGTEDTVFSLDISSGGPRWSFEFDRPNPQPLLRSTYPVSRSAKSMLN